MSPVIHRRGAVGAGPLPQRRAATIAPIPALALALALGCAGASIPPPRRPPPSEAPASRPSRGWAELDGALARSVRYLLDRQAADGAWRSEVYRALADGRALTPVVLLALSFGPPSPELSGAFARGSDYTATLVNAAGEVDGGPYGLEYPVYTLATSLLALSRPENARHAAARAPLVAALRARRLGAENGWPAEDPRRGGWGYFRGIPRRPAGAPEDELLASNLTSTLFATGALALAEVELDEPLFAEALAFVERCQNFPTAGTAAGPHDDGGFFFTPTDDVPNKAGRASAAGAPVRYRSYGTATADGLRALLRLGRPREHARVRAATDWLLGHYTAERVPGDYPPEQELYRASGLHYWLWTSSHALLLLGPEAELHPRTRDWPEQVARALLARQRPDGSFVNAATDLREDDPLVATTLAAAALALARLARADALGALRTSGQSYSASKENQSWTSGPRTSSR